jgi:hypothetical protein
VYVNKLLLVLPQCVCFGIVVGFRITCPTSKHVALLDTKYSCVLTVTNFVFFRLVSVQQMYNFIFYYSKHIFH